MPSEIGPHLLGRIPDDPDDRDWSPEKLRAYRDSAVVAGITPSTTLQEVHDMAGSSWGWLWWASALWHAIKALFSKPAPTPTPPSPPPGPAPASKLWNNPRRVLDQGDYGTCVGNGWAQWGNTDPVNDSYTENDARAIYYDATCIDGSCDDTYQNGSQVRSGAQAMQKRGRLAAYARLSSVTEIGRWVLTDGPVVVGTDWTQDMFNPDADSFVYPTGRVAGGHCFLLSGYDADTTTFTFENSWGSGWGDAGFFKMHVTDFAKLLNNGGDAWAALELPRPS